jgi:hypothetical protein
MNTILESIIPCPSCGAARTTPRPIAPMSNIIESRNSNTYGERRSTVAGLRTNLPYGPVSSLPTTRSDHRAPIPLYSTCYHMKLAGPAVGITSDVGAVGGAHEASHRVRGASPDSDGTALRCSTWQRRNAILVCLRPCQNVGAATEFGPGPPLHEHRTYRRQRTGTVPNNV